MKVLMLVAHPTIQGGIPKITPLLVSSLRSLGCQVVTVPWGRHNDAESLIGKVVGRTQDVKQIRQILAHQEFDVMVITTTHDSVSLIRDIPLLIATRSLCPAIVLHLHGSHSERLVSEGHRYFKALSTWLMRLSDAALVLSSEEQQQWQQFYPAGKFYTVRNPFLPGDEPPYTSSKEWPDLPDGKCVMLFVGRLIEHKGIFDLLKAFPRVLDRAASHLLIVGDGPQAERVRQYLQSSRLANHVTLTGYLQGSHLASVYRIAEILVLPTYWTEGFPAVLTEAMHAGLPIVTTRIRGAADHLQEGINAIFVPQRDPAALAEALMRLLADPALRARMSQANREKVEEFTPEVTGRRYLDILEEVTGRPGR